MYRLLLRQRGLFVALGLTAWIGTTGVILSQPSSGVAPPPDKASQDRAEALIKKLFRDDFQKIQDDPASGKPLAATLLQEGKATADDPALRYMALKLARDLAIAAGDLPTGMAAIAELTKFFKVDRVTLKVDSLAAAAKKFRSKETSQMIVDLSLELLGETLEGDNFDAARKLIDAADQAGQNLKSLSLIGAIEKRRKELDFAEKEFARIKPFANRLKENPDDNEASREMGRYYCLVKGKWERGLPLLANGDDEMLRSLAKKDLAKPAVAKGQVELGDSWYDYADSLKGRPRKLAMGRALHWYSAALPQLEGLTLRRIQTRVEELAKLFPGAPSAVIAADIVTETRRFNMALLDGCRALVVSPDNKYLLSTSFGSRLYAYDIASGTNTISFDMNQGIPFEKDKGFGFSAQCAAFSPDGKLVAGGSSNKSVQVWDFKSGAKIHTLTGHTNWVRGIHFLDGQRLLTAADDSTLRLWDYKSGKELKVLPIKHTGYINSLSVNKAGTRAATAGNDRTTRIWDLVQGEEIKRFDFPNTIYRVALSPDGKKVAVIIDSDSVVRVNDVDSGKELFRLDTMGGYVNGILFSPDGGRIFTGSSARLPLFNDIDKTVKGDNAIRVWDAANGKLVRTLTGHTKGIQSMAVSPSGRFLVTGSSDNTIRIWGEKTSVDSNRELK